MRQKWLDRLKRLGFCSLWLLAAQFLSCMVCFGVVNLMFSRDYHWEWLIYGIGVALPVLWGLGGYWLLDKFRPRGRWETGTFLVFWTVLPAVLCWWADWGGHDILWITFYPQLLARLAWFHPLYDGNGHSAFVLDTLQPLAAAGTHILMMLGFSVGLWARGRKKKV